jgi:hypothetical protein
MTTFAFGFLMTPIFWEGYSGSTTGTLHSSEGKSPRDERRGPGAGEGGTNGVGCPWDLEDGRGHRDRGGISRIQGREGSPGTRAIEKGGGGQTHTGPSIWYSGG